jgi:L-iditol 2-dehydrogenase
VLELTEGSGADTVLELSGARGAFREGFDLLRPSGRFVVVGQVGDAVDPIPPAHLTRANLSILGSWSGTVTHYWQAMEFLRRTRDNVDYDQMISGRYGLEDINTAMRGMRDFTEIKAAVLPNGEATTVSAAAAEASV